MSRRTSPLRIVMIAPARHRLREPHAGGLEACVWERVRGLRARGHEVTLCGPEGSDFLTGPAEFVLPGPIWADEREASDTTYPDGYVDQLESALNAAMAVIARNADRIDVVDNHSLHGAPIAWSDRLGVPVVTTLHTPPLPTVVEALQQCSGSNNRFLAVSAYTAREWSSVGVTADVFPNGVDTTRWRAGRGGQRLVWFGRLVPEKAPHLAIDAARVAGRRIVLAGRTGDEQYFESEVRPRLGRDAVYVGALRQPALARLVGGSAAALVTPMWDEPFGLVVAEAMATGTPVAAFDSGGVSEVVGDMPGATLVPAGDVMALADAASRAAATMTPRLRARVRAAAVARHSLQLRHDELEMLLARSAARVDRRVEAA